ncbi:glutamate racemase [Paenisporosarcina sp. OV554]|uniref:glutamate racemase n=1 Tax=Paenisporosarcina sp. OV554 TaxID=2135694 RepID=UPI000D3BC013|nr:glutamate racemase [Paenisporosarcina sp. OV554]PUB15093.1 glutamate racemase [Paenisporosarcina sp. OV554]
MNAPIGVIDSGVGGLTVVKELMRRLPNEQFLYIGDTARCPYGPRSASEVRKFTWQMAEELKAHSIKMLVVACNTATAVALESLQKKCPFPVVGVIFPGARAAIKATKRSEVCILGTSGTIQSGAYEQALKSLSSSCHIVPLACPSFVPLVESGEYEGDFAKDLVNKTLEPLLKESFDTLILGCTHYPLLQNHIEQAVGPDVTVLSSAEETADDVEEILNYFNLQRKDENTNSHIFFTTGSIPMFKSTISKWLEISNPMIEQISFK